MLAAAELDETDVTTAARRDVTTAAPTAHRDLRAVLAHRHYPRAQGALEGRGGFGETPDCLAALIGESAAMRRLRGLVLRLADADAAVLVQGENGTGKELVAQALHRVGRRAAEPLVALNCAAVAPGLVESELFGHERGAFTGAQGRRVGCLEAAGSGTLFLDEVAELAPDLQAKLLRVLESRRFQRVGADPGVDLPFRGRVVAATHQDLEGLIAVGRFRQDLYFRLNVVQLQVPALAEHREDIPLLVAHFLRGAGRGQRVLPEALEYLRRRPWPGNVRELRNAVERLGLLCDEDEVTLDEVQRVLGPSRCGRRGRAEVLARLILQHDGTPDNSPENKLDMMERLLVEVAMEQSGYVQARAARLLGVHRKTVERRWQQRGQQAPTQVP